MSITNVGKAIAAGALLGGLVLVQATPVEATPTGGPAVIAVHRDGAVDVPGNSTFGTIAKMSVPAGNWSMMASATLVGTDVTNRLSVSWSREPSSTKVEPCQLHKDRDPLRAWCCCWRITSSRRAP